MNFDLSEDEEMLKALAERYVVACGYPESRRALVASESGFSRENWALLGELGLIGALFAEADGGVGIGPVGLAAIFETLGRGLAGEPLIENVAIAGGLFAAVAPDALRQVWMERLVSGAARLALAHREPTARHNRDWVETRAAGNGSGACLNGHKALVAAGAGVDAYLVSARTSGDPGDKAGVSLFLVEAGRPGLAVRPLRMVDGSVGAALALDDVRVAPEHCLPGGMAEIADVLERALFLQSAEALGIMEKLQADTLEYLRTRTQFGAPLGSFQALQHRMVAQYAVVEQARALLNLAAMAEDGATRSRAVSGARAFIAQASVILGQEMIQMHGGMGVTDELMIGHGHKRLLMLSHWPEDAAASLDRYAAG